VGKPSDGFFYEQRHQKTLDVASRVSTFLYDIFSPSSVIDFGCGVGTWLYAFKKLGVSKVTGLDADYVDKQYIVIDKNDFITCDLTKIKASFVGYDIAVSLEVAEHLPPHISSEFVHVLTHAAPVILFSAAIPWQGGVRHINEQWQSFWQNEFLNKGFIAFDCIRPMLWMDSAVSFWYKQNIILYVSRDLIDTYKEALGPSCQMPDIVHPDLYLSKAVRPLPVKTSLMLLLSSLKQTIRKRLIP